MKSQTSRWLLAVTRHLDTLISRALGAERKRLLNEKCSLVIAYIKSLGHWR